jgi:hypothetical protein
MFVYAMRVDPCRSTFVIFFSQILFIWLITSVSYCHLDLVLDFFVDLAIHFLSRSLCHLVFFVALVTTLFVVFRYLIKGILLILLLSSYNLIPLLTICGSASHHLFGLTRRSGLHSMTTLKS